MKEIGITDQSIKRCDFVVLLFLVTVVFAAKFSSIGLPYYWDELGAYIYPSHWLAHRPLIHALPGLHPPEIFFGHPFVSYLAIATLFKLVGEHPAVAHVFVLLITTLGLWFTYQLGRVVHDRFAGVMAAVLLFFSPLYFAQSGMVTGDIIICSLGAMTVYFSLRDMTKSFLVSSVLLVLTKESAIAIIACLLIYDSLINTKNGMQKKLMKYVLPLGVFTIFFAAQKYYSGSFLPNRYFASHDFIQRDLAGIVGKFALVLHTIFVDQYRYILSLIVLCSFGINRHSARKEQYWLFLLIFASFVVPYSFILFLPRYIIPILPFFCVMAASSITLNTNKIQSAIIVISILGLFSTRILGYDSGFGSFEGDMQYADVVKVHRDACRFLEINYPDKRVLTAWPFNKELQEPHLGYVAKPVAVVMYSDSVSASDFDLILYSPQSDFPDGWVRRLAVTKGMTIGARFVKNGKYAEIYVPAIRQGATTRL